jgi:hypothetical protein
MNLKLIDRVNRGIQTTTRSRCTNLPMIRMQIRSGQRCIGCLGLLPPPHKPEITYCILCRPQGRRHTVYVSFAYRPAQGWHCKFLEWNLITPAGKPVILRDEDLLLKMAHWGGGIPFAHSLQTIVDGIRKGRGTFYLRLTDAQHKKLKSRLQAADASGHLDK